MTGRLVKEGRHRCHPPFYNVSRGDVWECNDCLARWKWCEPGNPGFNKWRRTYPDWLGLRFLRHAPDGPGA